MKQNGIRSLTAMILAVFMAVGLVCGDVRVFAKDEDTLVYGVNDQYRLDVLIEKATKEGKKKIVMQADADYTSDINITPNYVSWKGQDWRDKPAKRFITNSTETFVTFKSGVNIEVENIDFLKKGRPYEKGTKVVIERGATVHFKNAKFDNTVVNNGSATFENCVFATGEIENNGKAIYKGTTKEPKNIAKPKTMDKYEPLTFKPAHDRFNDVMVGKYRKQFNWVRVSGSESKIAKISAKVKESDTGLEASWERNSLSVYGTPRRDGEFTVELRGETLNYNNEKDVAIKEFKIRVVKGVDKDVYEFDETVRKTFDQAIKDAEKQGKRKIDQSRSAITGDVDITPQFTHWYGTDGAKNPKRNDIGYGKNTVVTFKKGVNITVKDIDFIKRGNTGAKAVIEDGAKVKFINCRFDDRVVNNGTAEFDNCTFKTGDIENNGFADYKNMKEPKNVGVAKQKPQPKPEPQPKNPDNSQEKDGEKNKNKQRETDSNIKNKKANTSDEKNGSMAKSKVQKAESGNKGTKTGDDRSITKEVIILSVAAICILILIIGRIVRKRKK